MSKLLALVPLLLPALALAQDKAPADRLRDTVRGAVQWIAKQAVPAPGSDGGVLFPGTEGKKGALQTCIYGGTAGVLIFLENAAAVLDDEPARTLADRTMKGLVAARRVDSHDRPSWTRGNAMGTTGLYTGDAGVGQAFLVRHLLRNDAAARAAAIDVGDALLLRAKADGEALTFGAATDIIFGNAGTALFLLDLGLATKEKRFLDASRRAGHGLLLDAQHAASKTQPERQLPIWVMAMGSMQMHMPNFSHGTAGVAYALARIGAETGDAALLAAARDGAQWLIENSVVDGDARKWQCSDRAPGVYMGGWCHGPAGTGRLFLLLGAITGDPQYRAIAEQGANFVVQYAAAAEQQSPDGKRPYVPPSYCCGVAGVVEFFCDLHAVTGNEAHAAFAKKAGDYLLDVAIADGDGRKWMNGQSAPGGPVAADITACNLDLMLGAAGEAMALLRLSRLGGETMPMRTLPDRTTVAPRAK